MKKRIGGTASDNRAAGREIAHHRAKPQRDHLRLKQQLDPQLLECVRDLLLDGEDVDAIAILAQELDLYPKPHRWGAMVFTALLVGAGTNGVAIIRCYNDERYVFMPRKLMVSDDTGDAFVIEQITDMGADRLLLPDPVGASAFRSFRKLPDLLVQHESGTPLEIVVTNNEVCFDFPLPIPFGLLTRGGCIGLTISNRVVYDASFEGFLLGELWTPDEWRARNPVGLGYLPVEEIR